MKKVWFITGASRGIGAHIATAALEAGYSVVATARRKEILSTYSQDERVLCLSLDVTNERQAHSAAQEAIEYFGQIDVLVNNAGYGLLGSVEETGDSEAKAIFDTNVLGSSM